MISKKEVVTILLIILICGGVVVFQKLVGKSNNGNLALIKLDGELIQSIDLVSMNDETFKLSEIEGVTFQIHDNKIRFLENDCKNQVCVNTGYISQVGDVAVCLPKKVSIEIVNSN
ncbi:MAG: NusG domain II-containing protein [Oscillospiraceae bacterium]